MSNYNRLDEIRQELSQMDYSALPNAKLMKLFMALDEATGDVQDILDQLTLLIPWADDWNNTKKMAEGGM